MKRIFTILSLMAFSIHFVAAQCNVSVQEYGGPLSATTTSVSLVVQGGNATLWTNTTTGSTWTGNSIQTSEPGVYVVDATNYDTYNNPLPCSTTYTLAGQTTSGGPTCTYSGYFNFAFQALSIAMNNGGYLAFYDDLDIPSYKPATDLYDAQNNLATVNILSLLESIYGGTATYTYGSAGAFQVTLTGSTPITKIAIVDANYESMNAEFIYSEIGACATCQVSIQQQGEFSEHMNTVVLNAQGSGDYNHSWEHVASGVTYSGWSADVNQAGLYILTSTDNNTGAVCRAKIDVEAYVESPGMYFDGSSSVTIPFANTIDIDGDNITIEFVLNPDAASYLQRTELMTLEYGNGLKTTFMTEGVYNSTEVSVFFGTAGAARVQSDQCNMVTWTGSSEVYWHSANGIYVDGTYEGGIQGAGYYDGLSKITLGKSDLTSPYDAYKGYIKEVRVWSKRRSAAEINAAANETLTGNEVGLVGYWKLDERDGQLITDESSKMNHGYRGSTPTIDANDPVTTESCGIQDIVVAPLNISYSAGEINSVLYPNPTTNGTIYVRNDGDLLYNTTFRVVSADPQVGYDYSQSNITLDHGDIHYWHLSSWPAGQYIMTIRDVLGNIIQTHYIQKAQ